MDIINKALAFFAPKLQSPIPQDQIDKVNQQKQQAYSDAYMKAKMQYPNDHNSFDQIKQLYDKYGDQMFGQPEEPTPTPQAHPFQHALQAVMGGQAQAAPAQPIPSPTPSDQQFPQQLIQDNSLPGADYDQVINKAGGEQGVPPAVLKAVLAHESMQFDPKYVGGYHTDQHGRGIAGIDDRAHPEITNAQAFDPNFAIPYAAKLLSGYHKQQGDWGGALREYNGGGNYASTAPGYQGVPINQRTMDYMNNVYKQAQTFGVKK